MAAQRRARFKISTRRPFVGLAAAKRPRKPGSALESTQKLNVNSVGGTWVLEPSTASEDAISDEVRAQAEQWLDAGNLHLPIMPEASALLLSMTSSDECTIQELTDVVQRDPLLAAHLLRIANSALYAPSYPASSLRSAIARLGIVELRRVAITIACQARVFRLRGWETKVEELFAHSLSTALYASEIAKLVHVGDDEAFLGGLLHDVGHAVVLQGLCDMEKAHGVELPRPAMLHLAEEHHTRVGTRLVEQWGLSPRLSEVIALHHHLLEKPSTSLAIVHLADTLAYADPRQLEALEQDVVVAALGLGTPALEELIVKRRQIVALAAALM
jgi:putative nucleotidyltransferase with HDIG domain